jgi:hypothetical protein
MQTLEPKKETPDPVLPVEVEVYINPDGSVTFADLEAGAIPIARRLNPDQAPACDTPAPDGEERGDAPGEDRGDG